MIQLHLDHERIRGLDDLLWLQGYACSAMSREAQDRAYSLAVCFGEAAAKDIPVSPTLNAMEFNQQLIGSGVSDIRTFSQTGESGMFAHAYYDEDTGEIVYDETFADDVLTACREYVPWREEEIRQALLLHEFFHHLEITRIGLTSDFITVQAGKRLPKAARTLFRDIAAFAFVHTQRPSMYCQLLDFFWLKKHAPDKYDRLFPTIQGIF